MKRILFLLTEVPDTKTKVGFILRMRLRGVLVFFAAIGTKIPEDEETLLVTDSEEEYERIKSEGKGVLIYIRNEEELDYYQGARFFVMDVFETEYEYFERVYRRIHGIPWDIANTKRLLLRETTVEDVDAFVMLYKDPQMTRYMEPLYEDVEEERKYAREYIEKVYEVQGFGIWTVVRKRDGQVIGRAGLTAREGFAELEIGFAIGTPYQRQGYGREAVRAVLSFAGAQNFGRINALVMQGNIASENLLSKEGFKKLNETMLNGVRYNVWQVDSIAPKKFGVL